MDPITHGVVGAAAGYAAAGRRLGGRAAIAGGLAAMLPDLDLLLRPWSDPALPWELHRHFSHALVFTPVGALAAWLPFLASRDGRGRPARRLLYAVCCLGYLSHSLLDNATSWGTLWYWPFSEARVALDIIAIVDPLFSLVILTGLALALKRKRPAAALAGLLIAGVYLGAGALQHGRALRALREAAEARGDTVDRLRVVPTLANIVLWRGLHVSDGTVHAAAIRTPVFRPVRVGAGASLPLVTPRSLGGRAGGTLQRFIALADGFATMTPDHPGVVGDMRYSLEPGGFVPLWGLRIAGAGAPEGGPPGQEEPGETVAWVDLLEGGPSFPQRVIEILRIVLPTGGR